MYIMTIIVYSRWR